MLVCVVGLQKIMFLLNSSTAWNKTNGNILIPKSELITQDSAWSVKNSQKTLGEHQSDRMRRNLNKEKDQGEIVTLVWPKLKLKLS